MVKEQMHVIERVLTDIELVVKEPSVQFSHEVFLNSITPQFRKNLRIIDSALDQIVAEMLLIYFAPDGLTSIKSIAEKLDREDPLGFGSCDCQNFYSYKIKRFVTEVALGMTPSKPWNGKLDATGGYLVVKESGEVLCYHIYDRNLFEDYLFNNLKLDTASTTRHDFGSLYEENGQTYLKLNLLIRF